MSIKLFDETTTAGSAEPAALVRAPGLRGRLERSEALLRTLLGRIGAVRIILGASLLGASASLSAGLGADDHIHRLSLNGSHAIEGLRRGALDLFRFANPEFNRLLMDQGVFPWWADPEARLAFFRPLASLTHVLDHLLWPSSAFMMHAQSMAWFLCGLLGLAALYRRLVEPRSIAALALFLYALDDARGGPISWIANRNALVAFAFSAWVLVAHDRWRRGGSRANAWLAAFLLALGLLAGEGAVATGAYLFAYALYVDPGSTRQRVMSLAPYAALIIVWRVTSRMLDYGSFGSGVYIDPLGEPLSFVRALVERLPILLLGQLAAPWSEMWNAAALLLPGSEWALLALAVCVIGTTAWLIGPLWRGDRRLRFWVVGALLAAVPPCATFPADRLLSWVSIGAAPVIAMLLAALVDGWRRPDQGAIRPALAGSAALILIALHLVIGPLTLPMRARGVAALRETLDRANDSLPKSEAIAAQTFIYVNPPADPLASYVPIMRADAGEPMPRAQRWLATGASEIELERLDAQTLRVRPKAGFLTSQAELMLRSPQRPLRVGDSVELSGFSARVTAVSADGRPAEAIVHFDRALEDPGLRFFQWIGDRYVPFQPPAIAQRVLVPKVDFVKVAYGAD